MQEMCSSDNDEEADNENSMEVEAEAANDDTDDLQMDVDQEIAFEDRENTYRQDKSRCDESDSDEEAAMDDKS